MDHTEDTPITMPGRPVKARADTNGVPDPIEFEDTGEILNALSAAGHDNLMEAFVQKAAEHFGKQSGGGGGGNAPAQAKAAKKQNNIVLLLMLIVGPGGAVGAHYALKGQADSNAQKVEYLESKTTTLEPRVEKTEENIRLIRVRVGTIDNSIAGINTSQTAIANGIEDLKAENVNRLQKELDKAERELRRRDRLDRDR